MFKDIYKKALQDEKVKQLKEKAKLDAKKQVFKKPFFEKKPIKNSTKVTKIFLIFLFCSFFRLSYYFF